MRKFKWLICLIVALCMICGLAFAGCTVGEVSPSEEETGSSGDEGGENSSGSGGDSGTQTGGDDQTGDNTTGDNTQSGGTTTSTFTVTLKSGLGASFTDGTYEMTEDVGSTITLTADSLALTSDATSAELTAADSYTVVGLATLDESTGRATVVADFGTTGSTNYYPVTGSASATASFPSSISYTSSVTLVPVLAPSGYSRSVFGSGSYKGGNNPANNGTGTTFGGGSSVEPQLTTSNGYVNIGEAVKNADGFYEFGEYIYYDGAVSATQDSSGEDGDVIYDGIRFDCTTNLLTGGTLKVTVRVTFYNLGTDTVHIDHVSEVLSSSLDTNIDELETDADLYDGTYALGNCTIAAGESATVTISETLSSASNTNFVIHWRFANTLANGFKLGLSLNAKTETAST